MTERGLDDKSVDFIRGHLHGAGCRYIYPAPSPIVKHFTSYIYPSCYSSVYVVEAADGQAMQTASTVKDDDLLSFLPWQLLSILIKVPIKEDVISTKIH